MMNNLSFTYTVFTPTFNREHTISRVYESLVAQTFRDFEWVVVDDGSTDGTKELIETWQSQADFPIVYHYQKNSGKHIAFNKGVQLARGSLFLAIDSDDAFTPESLETMLHWWQKIPQQQQQEFTGVVTLAKYDSGELSGDKFPYEPFDTTSLDMNHKFKLRGERWGFHRTEVLKEFPFPADGNVKFVPESIVWDAIARKYKIRCINETLRIYYQDSGNQITRDNPKKKSAVKQYFLQILNRETDYYFFDPLVFAKFAILYVRYSLHAGDLRFLSPSRFTTPMSFVLCFFMTLPGMAFYLMDILKINLSFRK
ncbi:glycosyltransferase family 2 protein [Methylobacillus sp.]|uniref:glycosyltransferase family 2 protein n=1 Tax=Methylobacillus sp. TaxID=56818 RepID=UPI002580DBFA|nr:glycosyltransferase family 2 protein [Methylobacillus sp.]